MPTLTDIVNDLTAALSAAETAEAALEAAAGADSAQVLAMQNALARFRAALEKNRETQAALDAELAQRTAALDTSAQAYAARVAPLKTQVDPGGSLAGSVQAAQAEAIRSALGLPDVPALDPLLAAVSAADAAPVSALTSKKSSLEAARTALDAARQTEGQRRSELEILEARLRFLAEDAGREAKSAAASLAAIASELDAASAASGSARRQALLRALVHHKDLIASRKRLIDPIQATSPETPFDVNNGDAAALRSVLQAAWTAARDALTAAAGARFNAEKAAFAAELEVHQAENALADYRAARLTRAAAAADTVLGP